MRWTADTAWRAAAVVLLVAWVVVLTRTAWLSDDAYITLRTVDNLLEGHGPRWNVDERVQTYTHPLWMLIVGAASAITGEYYFTTLAVCGLFSLAAVLLLAAFLWRRPAMLVACLAALVSSKAFVDFSTSGLENPLTHLLIGAFAWLCYREEARSPPLFALAAVAGLATWNRMDSLLLFLPALLVAWWRGPKLRGAALVVAGFLPFLIWEVLATVYYGSPLPNTAYAKLLGTGIPLGDLVSRGLHYTWACLITDPVTLLVVFTALASTAGRYVPGRPSRSGPDVALAVGVVLSLCYVLRIGGDHMSGRMFATPMFLSLWICAAQPWRPPAWVPVGLLLLGALVPRANLFSGGGYDARPPIVHGVVDERGFYYQRLGLLSPAREIPRAAALSREAAELIGDRRLVAVEYAVGVYAFEAGPLVHVVDPILCDPLLARLPAVENDASFVANHLVRRIPEGYLETVATGENRIRHPELAAFYDVIRLLTRGDPFAGGRAGAVLRAFGGGWRGDLSGFLNGEYRDPPLLRLPAAELRAPLPHGTLWQDGGHVVYPGGIEVVFDAPRRAAKIEVGLDSMDHYELSFLNGDEPVGRAEVHTLPVVLGGIRPYTVAAGEAAVASGYDRVRVVPVNAVDKIAALGWLVPR